MAKGIKKLFSALTNPREKVRRALSEGAALDTVADEIMRLEYKEKVLLYREFFPALTDERRVELVECFFSDAAAGWREEFPHLYEDEQIKILEVMAYLTDEQTEDFLWEHVASRHRMVGIVATRSFCRFPPKTVRKRIEESLACGDEIPPARLWELLGVFEKKEALKFLLEMLDNSEIKGEIFLLKFLGEMNDIVFLPLFERLADSADGLIRRKTVLALQKCDYGRDALPLYRRLLTDSDWSVRLQAFTSAFKLEDKELAPYLAECAAKEEHPLVKKIIADAGNPLRKQEKG